MSSLRCSRKQVMTDESSSTANTPRLTNRELRNLRMDRAEGRRSTLTQKQRKKELIVLMGNIFQIEHWHNCCQRSSIYEIIGEVASVFKKYPARLSSVDNPLTMVLRDRTRRGTLKIIFSNDCPDVPNLASGALVRCIGKIEQRNIMRAFRIILVQANEDADFERIRHVCQHAAGGSFV